MTITYPNGAIRNAIILEYEGDEFRVVEADSDDVQVFTRVKGVWYSENIDPVSMTFEWQRATAPAAPSVHDCICPKTLAASLIQTLLTGCDPAESHEKLPGFNAVVNFESPAHSIGR